MYGKLFAQMYEGTLYGQWEALVTFQQMIILCDPDGNIDMTPQAISSRTSIPLDIIKKGIEILESPDNYSRTPDQEGRRIERIDEHRPWGWHLVNHAKYRALQDSDTVRAQTRERVRKHRENRRLDDAVTQVTESNGQKRHTDTDTDTNKKNNSAVALPPWLPQDAWKAFDDARKKLRKPMTERAKELVFAELEKLRAAGHDPVAVLAQSVRRGWLDVFPLKDAPQRPTGEVI